jgi:hypothetical protein
MIMRFKVLWWWVLIGGIYVLWFFTEVEVI